MGSTDVEAYVTPVITNSKFTPLSNEQLQNHYHLSGLLYADSIEHCNLPIDILVGMNSYWTVVGSDIRKGSYGTPVAVSTLFGYVICGEETVSPREIESPTFNALLTETVRNPTNLLNLEETVKQFWELEGIGILASDELFNDEIAMQIYNKFVKYLGKHYEVGLIWRPDHPPLVSLFNKVFAMYRRQKERLDKNPKLNNAYCKSMTEFVDCDYVEEAPKTVPDKCIERHMPHHPIEKPGSTTYDVRPVFDASLVDENGISLNDCLLPGPSLIPKLMNILIAWRWWFIAFIGDIRRAFLQLHVREEDRDALRFIWADKVYRFCRVPFGVCCSPFLLNCTIRHHLKSWTSETELESELVIDLDQSTYVDDYVSGANDETSALSKILTARSIMDAAGMDLRKWSSNSTLIMNNLQDAQIHTESETTVKVLGIMWNTELDVIFMKPVVWNDGTAITKRSILSFIALVYDILGLVTPITIRGKILLQKLWKLNLSWDDIIINPAVLNEFSVIRVEFQKLHEVQLPRWLCTGVDEDVYIHLTCDASPEAYSASVYVVIGNACTLVASKSRVTPIRDVDTVPRIPKYELCSCLIGARLLHKILNLRITRYQAIFCWTDSKIVLSWINSDTLLRREIFVSNRVNEIRSKTEGCSWNYISSKDNPSDLATRAVMTIDSMLSSIWFTGPDWFKLPRDSWPDYIEKENIILLTTTEDSNRSSAELESKPDDSSKPVIDPSKHSRLVLLLRVTAYMFRFVKRKFEVGPGVLKLENDLEIPTPSHSELEHAMNYWISYYQKLHFADEISALQSNKLVSKMSKILDLGPALDDYGILRSVGRVGRVPTNNSPILLPGNCKFTKLLIFNYHEKLFHAGVTLTLVEIRTKFWIVKGRQAVKAVLDKCLICLRHKVPPYQQIPSALPDFRTTEHAPFSYAGIDFAGPFSTREGSASVLLITCASTRALHCEVTVDQTAPSILQALRRFQSRRGKCEFILSDNQKSFIRARKLLGGSLNWKMIPERAPWWGGFWERLVQGIKRAMRRALGRSKLTFEEFRTVIPEIESMINHRPLTYVSESREDPEPLRPVDFLLTPGPPPLSNASLHQNLESRFKYRVSIIKTAWKQWSREYLSELHRWNTKRFGKDTPNVGDIVLMDPLSYSNRALFPLGKIEQLIVGNDGHCRAVYVKINGKILRRSTRQLYPLELMVSDNTDNGLTDDATSTVNDIINPNDNIPPVATAPRAKSQNNTGGISRKNLIRTRAGRLVRKPERFGD